MSARSEHSKSRVRWIHLIAVLGLLLPASGFQGSTAQAAPLAQADPTSQLHLQAASGATVAFEAQDGASRELPYLVLTRNSTLTDEVERTLSVELTGIVLPPAGATLALAVETQHPDPDGDTGVRIPVWSASQRITNSTGITQTGVAVSLSHTFLATLGADGGTTPTDYFHVRVSVLDAGQTGDSPLYTFDQDHAFLMEQQWIEPLPEVAEDSPGAAPDELIVHLCDMFPFRRDARDPDAWVPRAEVQAYVQGELVPAMVEAFRTQSGAWGLAWSEAWTSYRPDDGANRLSVALSDGETWFHGSAPTKGNAGISINTNGGRAEYETLTDGLMSTFYHELFHNHQRNLHQALGGTGDVNGAGSAWDFVAEGTAVLASAVGQPEVELDRTWGSRGYLSHVAGFLGREGVVGGDLNESYETLNPYRASVYWRFLYEQCGGVRDGVEDPSTGMQVIRRVLETLYAGEGVDILSSADLVTAMPQVMDRALDGSACPFQTYEDSLVAFAGAVYALRLGGGFHDPNGLYPVPPSDTLAYAGGEVTYAAAEQDDPAGIPSSFGIDLIEVMLDPRVQGHSLTVELRGAPGAAAQFRVQLWTLDAGDGSSPALVGEPVRLEVAEDGAHLVRALPAGGSTYDRLGLAIVRVDSGEAADPAGAYTLVLHDGATE